MDGVFNYQYNKDDIKQNLTIEQVFDLLENLDADPQYKEDYIIARTICHQGDSHKLYYYDNAEQGGIFHCYSGCSSSFDIFELITKVKKIELNAAIRYVANFFGIQGELDCDIENEMSIYLKGFQKYDKIQKQEEKRIELKEYCGTWLQNLPQPRIKNWENENISYNTLKEFDIKYEPVKNTIIIPHYNIDNKLIGIRQRTLVEENEIYGKYLPYKLGKTIYRHMLGFNLYGINKNVENIKKFKHAILVESEKAVLQFESFFGRKNNIAVAVCGSAVSNYQIQLLLSLGVNHITVCFDKAGSTNAAEISKYVKKFYDIHNKYSSIVNIDFIYDKDNKYLDLKENPLDKNKEVFQQMYNERISLC